MYTYKSLRSSFSKQSQNSKKRKQKQKQHQKKHTHTHVGEVRNDRYLISNCKITIRNSTALPFSNIRNYKKKKQESKKLSTSET